VGRVGAREGLSLDSELLARLERIENLLTATARPQAEAVSLRQAARLLGIARGSTLQELIASGAVRTITIGRHVRIARKELHRVLEQGAPLDAPARRSPRRPAAARSEAEEIAAILAIEV